MIRRWMMTVFALVCLTITAQAAELPRELTEDLPEGAEVILPIGDFSGAAGFTQGVHRILSGLGEKAGWILRQRLRGAASVLLVVVACGMLEGFALGTGGGKAAAFLPTAGALAVTLLTAGSLDDLIALDLAPYFQRLLL